ncbi:MAG TPA: ABC transporter ATP-binding protein [Vicinamibacterales bacterium]|nr:ABC transporter ATP-binding protein [Vicinamibacterales bacterium]
MSFAIQTHALRKQFGTTLAVADLSLHVRAGEIFGFLGPNGAGKTTSIKMLLALVAPTSGTGRVLGAPIGDRAARARVGFLPEHFRFHDTLTAIELLRFHGRLYGLRGIALDARIDRLLTRVDLLDAADRPLRGYSKGMLQRVGLAQALLNDPQLVFLDEPTSGLDPLGRLLVRSIMDELRADGVAVFLNSHLLGEVEATCDRVAFVKRGRIVDERTLAAPNETLDVELRVACETPAIVDGLSRFGTNIEQPRPGTIVMRAPDEAAVPAIVGWLVQQGVAIHAVKPRRKSLEDVFLEVMGGDERPG